MEGVILTALVVIVFFIVFWALAADTVRLFARAWREEE